MIYLNYINKFAIFMMVLMLCVPFALVEPADTADNEVEVMIGGDSPEPPPEVVTEYVNVSLPENVTAEPVEKVPMPGFEAFMAMIGLLIVGLLVIRQKV